MRRVPVSSRASKAGQCQRSQDTARGRERIYDNHAGKFPPHAQSLRRRRRPAYMLIRSQQQSRTSVPHTLPALHQFETMQCCASASVTSGANFRVKLVYQLVVVTHPGRRIVVNWFLEMAGNLRAEFSNHEEPS